jgi:hypothetical protein
VPGHECETSAWAGTRKPRTNLRALRDLEIIRALIFGGSRLNQPRSSQIRFTPDPRRHVPWQTLWRGFFCHRVFAFANNIFEHLTQPQLASTLSKKLALANRPRKRAATSLGSWRTGQMSGILLIAESAKPVFWAAEATHRGKHQLGRELAIV